MYLVSFIGSSREIFGGVLMQFDEKTRIYFNKKVKQVFVYITNICQLRCKQCLYKPLLCDEPDGIDFNTLKELLTDFYNFGAYKVSFLGGEPTLYQDRKNNKHFGDVIEAVKEIGYTYIRVDTNGQFASSFLDNEQVKLLDEITFSLDGHNEETNDAVRGKGSYQKCVSNIIYAVSKGYKVQITSCVHKYSCPDVNTGISNLNMMIRFAQSIGVQSINFHPILKVGIARDNWIDDTDIAPAVWKDIYQLLTSEISNHQFSIKVRIPMRFVEQEKIEFSRNCYLYCPLEMGERALIMPDGQIKVCAFTIGTNECVARYDTKHVYFENQLNETTKIGSLRHNEVCYNQKVYDTNTVPLCMSFKPHQKELVWEHINNGSNIK